MGTSHKIGKQIADGYDALASGLVVHTHDSLKPEVRKFFEHGLHNMT